jgi:hypothetical protein
VETDSKFPTRLQVLGDALDLIEASDAALHRSRSRFESKPVSRMEAYGRPWLMPNSAIGQSFELVWCPPVHRAVAAYWQALKSTIRHDESFEGDLRTCRKVFKEAREVYEIKTEYRSRHGIEWKDGGASVSLRAILDARAEMVEAFALLEQVEGPAKYWRQIKTNKRAGENDRRLRRHAPELRERIRHARR